MNLTIIQNIYDGTLRPNLTSDLKFRELTNMFSNLPDNLQAIEKLFTNNFPTLQFDFEEERPNSIDEIAPDLYTPINEEFIFKKLELPLPKPSSPKEKFYQAIVNAEIQRVKLAIINYAPKQRSDIDTRKMITDTLKSILHFAKRCNSDNDPIMLALRTKLVCFYVELVSIASPLLTQNKNYLSFDDLMFEVFSKYPNDEETNIYNNFCNQAVSPKTPASIEKQIVESSPELQLLKTKYDTFMDAVQLYGFLELSKLKQLTPEKQSELVFNLVKSIPYAIAMINFLEYPKHLKEKYDGFHTKEALYRHVSKALNTSHDTIKGQFLAYNNPNSMKAINYTSYQYRDEVKKFYENLVCK